VSKKVTPSFVKPSISNNLPDRFGHRRLPDQNSLEHAHDEKDVCYKDPISSSHKDENLSERTRIKHLAQPNAVHSEQISRRSFGAQDRNVGWSYNSSVPPKRSDFQLDIELKRKWTQERSKSSSNGLTPSWIHNQKSACQSSLKPVVQSLQMWTPEKFQRLQERVCGREKLKDIFLNPSSQVPNRGKDTQLSNNSKEKLFSFLYRKKFTDSVSLLEKANASQRASY
jgi:hypothetical protein